MALPPLPCASVMNSSFTLGFLRRARSTRSKSGEVVNSMFVFSIVSAARPSERAFVRRLRAPSRPGRGRRAFCDLRQPSEIVIGRAGAFGRNHAGADRRFRRAGRAEDLTLPRLLYALQNLSALASLRVGDAQSRHGEARLGVEPAVILPQLQTAARNRAQAAPLEIIASLEDLADRRQRVRVAVARDAARVLVFDLGPAFDNLFNNHRHRLQNVERLEA